MKLDAILILNIKFMDASMLMLKRNNDAHKYAINLHEILIQFRMYLWMVGHGDSAVNETFVCLQNAQIAGKISINESNLSIFRRWIISVVSLLFMTFYILWLQFSRNFNRNELHLMQF